MSQPSEPGSGSHEEPTAAEQAAADAQENPPTKEWWDDPNLPWQGKPSKQDKQCWAAIALLGLYGIILLPLRPILLGLDSYVLAFVTGSNIAMADIGAKLATGDEPWWWVALLAAALTSVKFDWIFWWAGKLWGHDIIRVMSGRSKWAARTGAAAERLARKYGAPAIFLSWFIPFLPGAIVAAFVGDVGMKLRKYMLIDFIGALCYRAVWMYLGFNIGEPAKDLVKVIAKYANWFAVAMLIFIFVSTFLRTRRQQREAAS